MLQLGLKPFIDTEIIWLGRNRMDGTEGLGRDGDYIPLCRKCNDCDGSGFEGTEVIHLTWKRNGMDRYDTVVSEKMWFRIASKW
jgi:hypothetical protein